ncbi:uncharacterized protein LOC129794764 [Lutzomyia longipalpis]|uniref:uncharacterized protein LOC129794764 n=1 Tax=Lutzomyia longipalpis TaxID=7200 RepID=UPI0024841921|nr:uncharacterized protein LOC129794764 [Lutzomyia longipalpis]
MKSVILLGLLVVVSLNVCRGNPLTDAHTYLHAIFLDQKNYFDGIRIFVGTYSDYVTYDLMAIVTAEIEGWQSRGKTCRDSVLRPRSTPEFGEAFSICVYGAASHLADVQYLILANVEAEQVETHDIQMALMKELQTFNILQDYNAFLSYAMEMGRQIEERFYSVRYPQLIDTLEGMDWAMDNLPGLLQNCINDIPRQFTLSC